MEKNKLISNVRPNELCQHSRANLCKCDNRKIKYQEFIISWASTLIFEITQRDGNFYNSSDDLDFPFQLFYNENDSEPLEYTLTGRVYSTSSSGVHFYSKIIRSFNEQKAIYKYDDLNSGLATLESNDPVTLSGNHLNTILVSYVLNTEAGSTIYSNKQKG